MNPFRSSNPNLSSSDRTRDKKSTYIYAAAKKRFQTKRPCNTKNIKYYKKGTVRSIANYKLQQDLARGNVLCEDCNGQGNLCGKTQTSSSTFTRVHMHNNNYSVYQGGGTLIPDISWNFTTSTFNYIKFSQSIGNVVIKSDVSGVWNAGANYKDNISMCGPSNNILCPYGYIPNLIKIPRNLDGSGIIIDPSNILFPDDTCGVHSYFRSQSNLRTSIILRGTIDMSLNITIPTGIPFEHKEKCNDPSYNNLIGNFTQIIIDFGFPGLEGLQGILYGRISNICCLDKFDNIPWMDIYIEIDSISNYDVLSSLINTNPLYRGVDWRTLNPGGTSL